MSESSQNPQEHAFHCPKCNGRIVIPFNLPPTTGPCPHCQATITSPDTVVNTTFIDVDVIPVVETPKPSAPAPVSAPAPAPVTTPAPAPVPARPVPAPTVPLATYEAPEELKIKEAAAKPVKSGKKSNPIVLILVFFVILAGLGGGAYIVIGMLKPKNDLIKPTAFNSPTKAVVNPPTKPIINPTLEKYLAATSLDEKLNFVSDAEQLRPKMEAFYKDKAIIEGDTLASAFSMVPIPESDSKKGFMLFVYNQPAPSTTAQVTKILAFLKETEQGVKLDWEVFTQTRYRTFSNFIKTPALGKSEVFRVIITKEPPASPTTTPSYQLSDPAYQGDSIKIAADPKSQAGQALTRLDQESAKISGTTQRTATIELTWAGDPKAPQLQIKRFICWEFLGLGGKEVAETPPSN